ncbi:hypothetical protein Pst134EA_020801 [Puccinia striiformis f. sp. tritici]|nr:hypothetical protein Pst134EA_020801 [Puccinia striiformis f. sp. tritici]KAH9456891.1 hypothetical protein Pst134EA_020801 [Puccinia striiformis f. sp. tritici]KAI9629529.1 hypothetical protein KEM48_012876 [Puccinia striiformis f. sp. tritici PST-130]POW04938.1 hypothetical protein PSTT_10019 [Puccinia striiformis]
MGKSAKFYKRPTRKEKMGISSNSNSLRAAIASSKFNRPEPTILPKHERPITTTSQGDKPYSLIQSDSNADTSQQDLDMEVDQDSIIKRKNLKSKVNKNSHKLPESDFKQIDYVDLYDRPDRRKSSLSNAKKK